ncbi:hypothetical protein EA772_01600 [Pedobacter sp. G11]|uniref:hypothetical protein n=1 Tax=Pedobacter sp. G11 TaxID=2482728 RepID=UPI000F5DF313|nr:hypothetical protein [Pedobacter sp. G11]AZI24099.1 hypothetical protein EA772_01600 [Pedobacter sp. G11]
MLLVLLSLTFYACRQDPAKKFLPGLYTNSATGELSKADDTLVVESAGSNNYLLHRKTGYNLIREVKTGKRQHESEEWNAIYDEGTKTLYELRRGKHITIYPDSGFILIGKRKYTKQ